MQKKSVGLIVYTFFNGKLHAILQKRGRFNVEKMGRESIPGLCQVSVHGGLRKNETFEKGLKRETREEMPGLKVQFISLTELSHEENEKMEAITYGFVSEKDLETLLKSIHLHSGTGGLEIITAEDLPSIQTLNNPISAEDKLNGVTDGSIKMFPDELNALKKGFDYFSI